jgi:hypothetical protein
MHTPVSENSTLTLGATTDFKGHDCSKNSTDFPSLGLQTLLCSKI